MRRLVACACVALGAPHLAGAQTVRSARVVVDLTRADGSADVRAEYTLSGEAAQAVVSARALDFAEATVEALRVGDELRPVPILRPRGRVTLARLPVVAVGAGDVRVVAAYEVPAAVAERGAAVRGHVPLLSPDLPPDAATPGLFRAELRLPPDWMVTEGFPTGMTATGTPGTYVVDLAVVPALIGFRARSDGAWRPGLPLALDVVALLALLAFSALGWRHLRDGGT